ncbi:hypothetical protein F511_25871 [Dorcoceras hygrometricum]|uniref:Retrotransposon Copia-like N-terminal domain-containing protein n=1 Tax=Dorcoceras hygrometricum TaxID=472368 RepID=A0A2Z7ACR3_9LAMI|nr:hypothetical protein F511_25871 [Dorcoceras hygrometricum]
MSSFKNPLAAILDSNKFTGLNYQDWLRNLNLVLASEKLLYTIEKCPPKEAPADISPEELVTLKQWWDDEVKARFYVMASMSNEMQRRFVLGQYLLVLVITKIRQDNIGQSVVAFYSRIFIYRQVVIQQLGYSREISRWHAISS